MELSYKYQVEIGDPAIREGYYLLTFKVTACAAKGYPAKIWGPPENCYPGESDCVEYFSFKLCAVEDIDSSPVPFSKIKLDGDEFVWLFGQREFDMVEQMGYDVASSEYEDMIEARAEDRYDNMERYDER